MPSYMNNLPNFMCKRLNKSKGRSMMFFPLISVTPPGLLGSGSINNYTVCLMHEKDSHGTPMVKLFAFLVNHHNGRIALYENLYVCFEGIQPKYHGSARFNLVDLGNGKLCAILCTKKFGRGPNYSFSVMLSISVFTLSLLKDLSDLKLLDSPMKKDFLEVTSLKKSVYTIKDASMSNIVRHAFVWPPTKEEAFQHRAILL
ncbi:hypothetical protein PIB30_037415 [Stylosanthes scabra]|uniref:Uncharacterized protein n=1 Tax=Stylosanthes scabra TaxID=79078 RepID=A0ABU6YEF1_9FABA|nr:hypothetical protein [Stylosanthes scabra]